MIIIFPAQSRKQVSRALFKPISDPFFRSMSSLFEGKNFFHFFCADFEKPQSRFHFPLKNLKLISKCLLLLDPCS